MNIHGLEAMQRESMARVSEASARERAHLQSHPDAYLKGYTEAYQDGNPVIRFLNGFTLRKNVVRYGVACQLLEERELARMDYESLEGEAEANVGFFTSFSKTDRRNKARDLLKERNVTT